MNFRERFKFFALGSMAGIFLVILLFGNRTSCKDALVNYFPQGRVKQEILFYPFKFSDQAKNKLNELKIDTALFKNKYIQEADVDFDLSEQRAKPCGKYVLISQDSIQQLEILLDKCRNQVLIQQITSKKLVD